MLLNKKGKTILSAMKKEYGVEKGTQVFYSSIESGKVKGVEATKKTTKKK